MSPANMSCESAAPVHLRTRPVAFIIAYVARHPWRHGVIFASILVAVGAAVGAQYALKHLIDVVTGGPAAAPALWDAFALLVGVIALDNLTWRLAGWQAAHVFVEVSGEVRRDLLRHLLGHASAFFAERLPGTLAGRVSATANALFQIEQSLAWNVIPPALATLFAVLTVSLVDWQMALALIAIGALISALVFRLARRGRPLHRAFAEQAAAVDGQMVDVVANHALVRAFGAIGRERVQIGRQIAEEMSARRTSLLYLENLRLVHALVTALMTAGLLAWVLMLWQAGAASPGDVMLVASLGFTVLHGTRDLAMALVDLTQHVARLGEAAQAILADHQMVDQPNARPLVPAAGAVTFESLRFAYPGRPPVFDGFDLKIAAGCRLGLVGRSGGGKSTLITLLQRLYDIEGGRILIDGQDIAEVTGQSLAAAIAVVPQDVALLHRSLRDNIRYGRPEASDAAVERAADLACCRDFIAALPDGLDTLVGDRGVKLSGGQRQRVAIARAFLKDAPILLLDEATSALDTESEEAVQRGLERLMAGRTVIAIAHRLSTLQNFDRIVVIDHGQVLDDGDPAELAARPGPYRSLLEAQGLGPTRDAA